MKKNRLTNIILVLMFIIGLSLLLYPSVADYWNSFTQSYAIASYTEQLADMDKEEYEEELKAAREYNADIIPRGDGYVLSTENKDSYDNLLDIAAGGIMGYIDIPTISVTLPIYHGTGDEVLQVAAGHLDWTSLPVGGESTHSVISGHRGLVSARLFTDLDQLVAGDYFMVHVLNETLTYEIDQIRIVEPQQIDDLLIQKGKDLFTLVTCTPYGINSHRLLVRGHRVNNLDAMDEIHVTGDAIIIEKLVVAPFVLVPILLLMLIPFLISTGKSKKRRQRR